MSSGLFRGKESSNRIKLSRLVQDLLNFGVLGFLWLWGGGRWVGVSGGMGVSPHMCTCTHTHAHVYMNRNCKWPPTWRHPCLSCLTCMCMHAWDTPHTPMPIHPSAIPMPIHPSAIPMGDPGIGQNSITLELIKIFQFCLKIYDL